MNEGVSYLGGDIEKAISLVKSKEEPDIRLTIIDSGYDNLVITAGDKLYRFPRSGEVWERGLIERSILEKLSSHPELSVPHLLSVNENPAYAVLTSIPGRNLSPETIRSLGNNHQQYIGEQIGIFAYHFHRLFQPDDIKPFLPNEDPQAFYANYLQQVLKDRQEKTATWVRETWPKHNHPGDTVIHDDLHTHNMLFDDDSNLTGVIDFGDVSLGSPEQELRYTYWISDIVLDNAIATYEQLAHKSLSKDLLVLCAVSQEITGLYDPKRSYMHKRALHNLSFRELL